MHRFTKDNAWKDIEWRATSLLAKCQQVERTLLLASSDSIHLKCWVCKTRWSWDFFGEPPIQLSISINTGYATFIRDRNAFIFGKELDTQHITELLIKTTSIAERAEDGLSQGTSLIVLGYVLSFTFPLLHKLILHSTKYISCIPKVFQVSALAQIRIAFLPSRQYKYNSAYKVGNQNSLLFYQKSYCFHNNPLYKISAMYLSCWV